jgi:uncharacterized protein
VGRQQYFKNSTSVISRSIKPGYEKHCDDWLRRYFPYERTTTGYLGTTIILRAGTSSNRYIIHRFTDKASMDTLENSQAQKILEEVNNYSIRHYETATRLELWFAILNDY